MKKEQLIELGLSEDLAEKVASASSEELKNFIPKSRFDEVNSDNKTLKSQIEELSKVNPQDLQQQIETLKNDIAKKESDYQTKIKQTTLNSALKLALNGKVHDVDLVSKLLDINTIELDDNGNITKGLDEQVKTLQESKSFLFIPEKKEEQKPIFKFGADGGDKPKPTEPNGLGEALFQKYNK